MFLRYATYEEFKENTPEISDVFSLPTEISVIKREWSCFSHWRDLPDILAVWFFQLKKRSKPAQVAEQGNRVRIGCRTIPKSSNHTFCMPL